MNQARGVIEIGSTGIRLMVAEILEPGNKHNILDKSDQSVSIGRDVFTTGIISRETLVLCLQILERYGEQLMTWGISRSDTIVIATSAVREAKNRDPFIDRIKVKTGFTVRVTDGIEENRLMYLAVKKCLKDEAASVQQSNSIIIDVSGGATEMMLLENGRIVGAHSMRLGTVIIEQKIKAMMGTIDDAKKITGEFIRNAKTVLNSEMSLDKARNFIVLGNDMKLAALFAGKPVSPFIWEIDRKKFIDFSNEVKNYTADECTAKFRMNYSDVTTFQISMVIYRMFLELTGINRITVPDTSIREGVFLGIDEHAGTEIIDDFSQQICAGAISLLKKYQGDEQHAEFVRDTALKLYDSLENELGLGPKARMLMEISSILHDIGMFIGADNHHEHGRYIIENSEIFGLTRDEKSIVALIVNFHRGKKMPQDDSDFRLLPRTSRMTILKLTAIIRVADALDRNHLQHISDFNVQLSKDTMTIRVKGHHSLSMEKIALAEKGALFENVFAYKIVLV